MSAGLRNQRIRLYRRVSAGSDGMIRPVFMFTGEWWGRLEESRASSWQSMERIQMTSGGAAEFSDEVDVPTNGIAVDTGNGQAWWIRGITNAKTTRRKLVQIDRISDEEFTTMTLYDSQSQMDGTHLVNPLPD